MASPRVSAHALLLLLVFFTFKARFVSSMMKPCSAMVTMIRLMLTGDFRGAGYLLVSERNFDMASLLHQYSKQCHVKEYQYFSLCFCLYIL